MKLLTSALVASGLGLFAFNGLDAQRSPLSRAQTQAVNMGAALNASGRDAEPTFGTDRRTMYFNCADRTPDGGNDICTSTLVGGQWTRAEIVPAPISTEYTEVEPLLSPDGNQLYIMSDRPGGMGGADIWVSDKVDGEWTEPRNLGAPINSPYADHCLYFTGPDWSVAYWTSTRPGGYGGNDIWRSERVNGVWQEAVNLGPQVNSEGSEHHSLPSADGRSLYITATRDEGYGEEDIYVSKLDDGGEWGPLVNLGPLVNTVENDRCPAFSPDFQIFYFDSERDGGYGDKDLWWVYTENISGG
jgi:hypothetical protein